jgi:hypothetical protein
LPVFFSSAAAGNTGKILLIQILRAIGSNNQSLALPGQKPSIFTIIA